MNFRLLVAALCIVCFTTANSQPQAIFHNDTLTLSNRLIKRQFLWNNGELISLDLIDLKSGKSLVQESDSPALQFNPGYPVKHSAFKSTELEENKLHSACLKAEVLIEYGSFKIKRVFRISGDTPAIACENYILINHEPGFETIAEIHEGSLVLERVNTAFESPKLKAIEFFDRTDENNNLVQTKEVLAFNRELKLRGNLLQAGSAKPGQGGIFVLKEAPCSFVQLSYPGYDFKSVRNTVTVEGAGMPEDWQRTGEWIQLYGSVLGIFDGTEQGFRNSLRSYQNSIRRTIPERDNMIMMNTWGDRNRDASISEAFLKAELDACEKLGVSHFQIDDGWQQGLSTNSAYSDGQKWDLWDKVDWEPHTGRLPNGLNPVVAYAREKGVRLGLWFHPSTHNSNENWETDAEIILSLYRNYDIRYFKIDGIRILDKMADHRLRLLFDRVSTESDGNIVINLDATAGNRTGYNYMNTYGNIFLENRYTDWGNYYPHWTLRNLWQLSAYVPTRNLQIEFLNKWRNRSVYGEDNSLAPYNIPFEYQFAITMMAQPLAWFEGTGLPEEALKIAPVIKKYREIQEDIHSGNVFPIGNEPDGYSWSGFQSVLNNRSGYLLVFREKNSEPSKYLETLLPPDKQVVLTPVLGEGKMIKSIPNSKGEIRFELAEEYSYCLFKYIIDN